MYKQLSVKPTGEESVVLVTWPSQHSGWRAGGGRGRGGAGPSRPARPPEVTLGTLACSPRQEHGGHPRPTTPGRPTPSRGGQARRGPLLSHPAWLESGGLDGHCLSAPSRTFLD